jgi:hypothetical protein
MSNSALTRLGRFFPILFLWVIACPQISNADKQVSVYLTVADIPCEDALATVLSRLESADISWSWFDKIEKTIVTEPKVVETYVSGIYKSIKESYILKVSCENQVFTTLEAAMKLEGLTLAGDWTEVVDVTDLQDHGERFLMLFRWQGTD